MSEKKGRILENKVVCTFIHFPPSCFLCLHLSIHLSRLSLSLSVFCSLCLPFFSPSVFPHVLSLCPSLLPLFVSVCLSLCSSLHHLILPQESSQINVTASKNNVIVFTNTTAVFIHFFLNILS